MAMMAMADLHTYFDTAVGSDFADFDDGTFENYVHFDVTTVAAAVSDLLLVR